MLLTKDLIHAKISYFVTSYKATYAADKLGGAGKATERSLVYREQSRTGTVRSREAENAGCGS